MQTLQPAVDEHGAQFVADQAECNERVSLHAGMQASAHALLQLASLCIGMDAQGHAQWMTLCIHVNATACCC